MGVEQPCQTNSAQDPARLLFGNVTEPPPGVVIKIKQHGAPLMHFKAYQIDGRVLRTGSANFSPSGLKRQDNDLVVIENPAAAEAFKRDFERIFPTGDALEQERVDYPAFRPVVVFWSELVHLSVLS